MSPKQGELQHEASHNMRGINKVDANFASTRGLGFGV